MKYIVRSPHWGEMEFEDVRDARIEANWRQDQMCMPGTFELRSLNPQCYRVQIFAEAGVVV